MGKLTKGDIVNYRGKPYQVLGTVPITKEKFPNMARRGVTHKVYFRQGNKGTRLYGAYLQNGKVRIITPEQAKVSDLPRSMERSGRFFEKSLVVKAAQDAGVPVKGSLGNQIVDDLVKISKAVRNFSAYLIHTDKSPESYDSQVRAFYSVVSPLWKSFLTKYPEARDKKEAKMFTRSISPRRIATIRRDLKANRPGRDPYGAFAASVANMVKTLEFLWQNNREAFGKSLVVKAAKELGVKKDPRRRGSDRRNPYSDEYVADTRNYQKEIREIMEKVESNRRILKRDPSNEDAYRMISMTKGGLLDGLVLRMGAMGHPSRRPLAIAAESLRKFLFSRDGKYIVPALRQLKQADRMLS